MKLREWLLRAAALTGLAVSCALVIDYVAGGGGVCSADGCTTVRESAWARPLGVPLPVLGVAYFAALLVAITSARRWLTPLAVAGAAGAAGFIAVQALVIGALCPMCMVVDGAAIAAAALAWRAPAPDPARRHARRWYGAYAAVAVATVAVSLQLIARGPEISRASLPAPVAAAQRDGVATIVKFADFRCPHCRELHHRLAPLLEEYGDAVQLVLRPGLMSRASVPAAATYCCAEILDPARAPAMADALFSAARLAPDDCLDIGENLGFDRDQLSECMRSEPAAARLSEHLAAGAEAGVARFPTTWIGDAHFEGAPTVDQLRELIARAIAAES